MPTSGHQAPKTVVKTFVKTIFQPEIQRDIKKEIIKMSEPTNPTPANEGKVEEVLTQQDFQDFIAIFNAGVLSQIKPLRLKQTQLEEEINKLKNAKAEKSEVVQQVKAIEEKSIVLQKEIEKTTNDDSQTSFDLQELINKIPNITADVKKFFELFLSLYEAWRVIFKTGIKEEENIAQMKACVANLAKPIEIEVKSLVKKPVAPVAPSVPIPVPLKPVVK